MMCPSCGEGKLRSHLHVCAECGEEFIGKVAAKHLDRIAKEFNQIRLDHLRKVETERDEARSELASALRLLDEAGIPWTRNNNQK